MSWQTPALHHISSVKISELQVFPPSMGSPGFAAVTMEFRESEEGRPDEVGIFGPADKLGPALRKAFTEWLEQNPGTEKEK